MDVGERPLGRLGGPAHPAPTPAAPTGPAAVGVAVDEAIAETRPIRDPYRAIDWLSTFPQVVLIAMGRAGGQRVEVPDAARDGRAVVYAAIQAEPLVARAATLLADAAARPAGHRAGRDERRDRRPRGLASDVPHALGPVAAAGLAAAEAILAVSLEVAAHGDQVRNQVRGAIVEELTARLLARRG